MNQKQQRVINPIPNMPSNSNGLKIYQTGLYVRLSVEDGGLSKESESLIHQEQFLMRFLEDHPELILTKVYRDNGETGTDFDRPGFLSMMNDLKRGVINCIVVKDLSRFGRDYVQTGEYIEKIFPFMETRFISILEGFDNTKPNARDMMMVNLKNLLNEAYAKDKSKRICSAFDAKRANGEFNVKYAPYGYLISGDKKSPYKVDPEAAPVIREIFDLREQGMSILSIARLMDEKGYLTPIQYALKKGIRKKANGDNHWTSVTIDRILNNPAYLGHMYMRQTETRLYQGIKRRKVDKKDQFIVKNVNEPIVSQEQFDMVHSMKRTYEKKKKSSKAADNVLKGFLYCAECGKLLFRNHSHSSNGKTINYFSCPTYRDHLDKYCTHKAGMREDEIKAVILEFIKSQARLAGQIELRANAALELDMAKNRTSNKNTVISELKAAIEREEYLARDAFECYVLGSIAEDEYMCQKEKHESEKRQLQERLKKAEKSTSKGLVEAVKSNSYVQLLKTLTRARTVTREMCEALLERIDIDKDHNVKITVKYRDEFADFLKTIKETEAELKDVG